MQSSPGLRSLLPAVLLLLTADVSLGAAAHWGDEPENGAIRQRMRGYVQPGTAAHVSIRLSNGYLFDPLVQGEPALPAALRAAPVGAGQVGGFIVQLSGPIRPDQRAAIEAAGAAIAGYLPDYAYLVRMTPEARARVEALDFVRWVGAQHPAYKLCEAPEMLDTSPRPLIVVLFLDADMAAARAAVEALGGAVLATSESSRNKLLKIHLDPSRAGALAAREEVAWIEPWYQPTLDNSQAQWVVQTFTANLRRIWDMGLHGEGQVVHTSDSGINTDHNAFRDAAVPITGYGQYPTHRKVIGYVTPTSQPFGDHLGASSYHGTHTAGSVVGDDSPFAADPRDGQALKAKIYFSDCGGNSSSIFPPDDLYTLFLPAYTGNAGGAARLSSNSWSAPTNLYTIDAVNADRFMWDHKDFLVFFSTGNNAAPGVVGSPATCKNGVGSGGTQNGLNANMMYVFTSRGPTNDGRLKPTILAPGEAVLSANGGTTNGYSSKSGTSMSCPTKTGATLLVRQYFTEGWYPTGSPRPGHAFTPSGALLKAMAINSTDNDMTGPPIPNDAMGWGRIKMDNVLYFPGDAQRLAIVDEDVGLATGEFFEYEVDVEDGTVPLKMALCWSDREGMGEAGVQLVNNLDLVVTDPGGLVFYQGNNFAQGQSAPGGAPDVLNVEECVRVNAPTVGTWTVRVTGMNIPAGPQPFGLAITGALPATTVGVDEPAPARLALRQNAPNPFVGSTTIQFAVPQSGPVELAVFGMRGERVKTLVSGPRPAGNHSAVWDGTDQAGRRVGSGVYFYRLAAGGLAATRRMAVIR
jgi:subtilase family protein/flagellar hook capping protein FlgD